MKFKSEITSFLLKATCFTTFFISKISSSRKRAHDQKFVRVVPLRSPKMTELVEELQKQNLGSITASEFQHAGRKCGMVTVNNKIAVKLLSNGETAIQIFNPADKSTRLLKKRVLKVLMNQISI